MLLFRDLNGIIAIDFKEKKEPKMSKKYIYIHTHTHTYYIYIVWVNTLETHNDHF